MKPTIASEMFLILLLVATLALTLRIELAGSSPKTIIVPDDYPTIQGAIDHASSNDTVFVKAGHYNETITIYKSLNLLGEDQERTIIDGQENRSIGKVVDIFDGVANVNITGFTIENSKNSPHWGIYIGWRTQGINIVGNKITGDIDEGIRMSNCTNALIKDNVIIQSPVGITIDSGSVNVNVSSNTIAGVGHHTGGAAITVSSSNANIIGNRIADSAVGISLFVCASNKIIDNIIDQNMWICIRIENCSDNTLSNNLLSGEWCAFEFVGTDKTINGNTVSDNIAKNCSEGIRMHSPFGSISSVSNNVFSLNTFQNCGTGVIINSKNVSDNYFYHNNFIDNTVQARDESANFWNKSYPIGGNYWNDYAGRDEMWGEGQNLTGSDVIGDTPYMISGGENDSYPLTEQWPAGLWTFETNSTAILASYQITDFVFNQTQGQISFRIDADMSDSCGIIFPKAKLNGVLNLLVDGNPAVHSVRWSQQYYRLNFTTGGGNHSITVTGEYTSARPTPEWPDITGDGKIDMRDIGWVAKSFGRTQVSDP